MTGIAADADGNSREEISWEFLRSWPPEEGPSAKGPSDEDEDESLELSNSKGSSRVLKHLGICETIGPFYSKMDQVTLMEGSFGTQLEKYVGNVIDGDPLWSARFIVTDKHKCIMAHRDLVRAGTKILTTGSYQASVEGYMTHMNLSRENAIEAIKDSVRLARKAIKLEEESLDKKLDVKVAGSIGPYGAFLHDGSDYTGSYKITKNELKDWHRSRFEALLEEKVDLLGFETIPNSTEAEALIELLQEHPEQKAWLSFSCKDDQSISSGENFYEVVEKCWLLGNSQLIAIGVNCLQPEWVSKLFEKVRTEKPEIPLIAYPNSGEKFDKEKGRWMDKETSLSVTDYTQQWLDLGVKYIGGCCRTNDEDVKQFSKEIAMWENKKASLNNIGRME